MSYTKTQWENDQAPAINATNLNKIEQGIYDNDSAISNTNTNVGDLTSLTTTANTDLVSAINEVNAKSEIDNTYGTSQTRGYSQEYQNAHNVIVSATQPTNKSKVWLQHSSNMFPTNNITVNQIGTNYDIKVKPDTSYTISYTKTRISGVTISNQSVYDFQLIRYFNANGTQISQETSTLYTLGSSDTLNVTKTFTPPANTSYVRINFGNNNGDNNNNTLVSNIMLNLGSTAIPYEAYIPNKEYILNTNNEYEEFYSDDVIKESFSADINTTYLSAGGIDFVRTGKMVDCKLRLTLKANSSAAAYLKIINNLPYKPKQEQHIYFNLLSSAEVLTTNQGLIQVKPNGEMYLKTTGSYSAGQLIIIDILYIIQ